MTFPIVLPRFSVSRSIRAIRSIGAVVAACLFLAAAQAEPVSTPPVEPVFVPLEKVQSLDSVLERIRRYRAVIVGETHDRYDHHLNQLGIIRGLQERGVDLAVDLEFFQRPFQPPLDDYVAGRMDEGQMLRATEYYQRWGFDYRLYRPILEYARDQNIPLIALNMEREITAAVSEKGLDGLSDDQKNELPDEMEPELPGYRERLKAVYDLHPVPPEGEGERDFERFLSVQLLWDETMAEMAARYLEAYPGRHMVILAGSGHVEGTGIPLRLKRRIGRDQVISVLQTGGGDIGPDDADLLILSRERRLPPVGKMGILMEDHEDGGVLVQRVWKHSAAEEAGLEEDDVLTQLAGKPVGDTVDVRLILRDRKPGETLSVTVQRPALFGSYNEKAMNLILGGATHE